MAKIFRKMHNPYALCAITHSLTLTTITIHDKLFLTSISLLKYDCMCTFKSSFERTLDEK